MQLKSVIPSLWFALEDFLGGWREGKLNERMSQAILKWSWLHCLEWKYCRRVRRRPPKFFLHFCDVARKLFSQLCPMSNIQWNSSLDFIRLFLVIWIGWWKSILSWSPTKDRNVKCSYFGGGMYLLKWDLHNCLKVVSYPFIIQILQCSMPENGNLVIYLLRKMILLFSLII